MSKADKNFFGRHDIRNVPFPGNSRHEVVNRRYQLTPAKIGISIGALAVIILVVKWIAAK